MMKDFNGEYDVIEGRNPVLEAFRGNRSVKRVLIAKGIKGLGKTLLHEARSSGVEIEMVDRNVLDQISVSGVHQGVIALVSKYKYVQDVDSVINAAYQRGEEPFIIVLDKIKDPHNLGAIIRTAHCCGVHGVVVQKKNAVGITPVVVKASAGALEYVPIVQVTNISRTLEKMKELGLWIAGADMDGEMMYDARLTGSLALVIGSEGKGIGRLVRQKCDFAVRIPMKGNISSLNASVAAGVLMYEVIRQRCK